MLFGLLIVLLSIKWLSEGDVFFSRSYALFAEFREVNGLRAKSPVLLRGYRIGVVSDVAFRQDAVVVRLSVEREVQIPVGATFTVSSVNLMGEKGIAITAPDIVESFLQAGDTVSGDSQDIMATLLRLVDNISDGVESGDPSRRIASLGQSIDRLESILAKLDSKLDQIDIADLNRQVAQIGEAGRKAQVLIDSTQTEIHDLTDDSRMTLAKLSEACDSLSRLAGSIRSVSDSLTAGNGTAAQLLNSDETITKLNATIDQLRALLEDVQAHPRKYVKLSIF
jgi:phospholipid/cholesterol/gamma-HCH transport system substrate-binding protein